MLEIPSSESKRPEIKAPPTPHTMNDLIQMVPEEDCTPQTDQELGSRCLVQSELSLVVSFIRNKCPELTHCLCWGIPSAISLLILPVSIWGKLVVFLTDFIEQRLSSFKAGAVWACHIQELEKEVMVVWQRNQNPGRSDLIHKWGHSPTTLFMLWGSRLFHLASCRCHLFAG